MPEARRKHVELPAQPHMRKLDPPRTVQSSPNPSTEEMPEADKQVQPCRDHETSPRQGSVALPENTPATFTELPVMAREVFDAELVAHVDDPKTNLASAAEPASLEEIIEKETMAVAEAETVSAAAAPALDDRQSSWRGREKETEARAQELAIRAQPLVMEAGDQTEIHISIGSIELRPPRAEAKTQQPFRPRVSLDEFLKRKPGARS